MRVLGRLDPAGFDGLILPDGDGGVVLTTHTYSTAPSATCSSLKIFIPNGPVYPPWRQPPAGAWTCPAAALARAGTACLLGFATSCGR